MLEIPHTQPEPPAPAVTGRVPAASLAAFIELCGPALPARVEALCATIAAAPRGGRMVQTRHALELTLARLAESDRGPGSTAERRIVDLAGAVMALHGSLDACGQDRLRSMLETGLSASGTLIPVFHLIRTIELQRSRGFTVVPVGLADAAPFDILLRRDGEDAELACETVSAEEGRDLHRSAWFSLVDGIDPDLQTWLSAHPGRYLLKMTLPNGLRGQSDPGQGLATLSDLQRRIRDMLSAQRRADHDEAAVLRLDPLLLAGAQARELGLMDALRQQFGPEAQLAVTRSGNGVFVMAARAGRENHIGGAVRARLAAATPARFGGRKPAILSILLEDTDRAEWRALRDTLQLEGETRQFLTCPEAAPLVAVTAASRIEMLDPAAPDSAPEGEIRFRNQAHPAAKSAALAPSIRSCG